jgi:hypothetical protein
VVTSGDRYNWHGPTDRDGARATDLSVGTFRTRGTEWQAGTIRPGIDVFGGDVRCCSPSCWSLL